MTIFCLKLAVFSKPLPTFEELGNESTKIQFWLRDFYIAHQCQMWTGYGGVIKSENIVDILLK